MDRRTFNTVVAAGIFGSLSTSARAAGPVLRMVVPFNAGGVTDLLTRTLAEQLTKRMDRPVIVENRTGAAGMIGTNYVAKSAPDGNTICAGIAGTMGLNRLLYKSIPYDVNKELALIILAVSQSSLLTVSSRLGVSNIGELTALLKANPDKYAYASSGAGSISHLAVEAYAASIGTKLRHIPFPSSNPGIMAMLAGDIDIALHPTFVVMPFVKDGRLKAIAISTRQRSKQLPDIPTLEEGGATGIYSDSWIGYVAPAGTPQPVMDDLYQHIGAALRDPPVMEFLRTQYMEVVARPPAEFRATIDAEVARWKPVIEQLKISLD